MRLLALLALAPLAGAADVYQAPSPEPTPEETLILQYMNRFRADPVAEADLIAPANGALKGWIYQGVDLDMFRSEVKALKAAPPLVFSLQLLESARKHSHYMILNGLTHVEEPGKAGFTGASFSDRIKATGYQGSAGGENCYAAASDAWNSHAAFIIDSGKGGPGGMQPERGHRKNMISAGYNEVGCSAVPSGDRFSVTHNFGRSSRKAGGVVYVDLNKNGFYDIGEGRGGVKISGSDGSSCTTWASGAFTLELKGGAALTISAEHNGQHIQKQFAAGNANVAFEWIIPQQADLDLADRLLADLAKAKDPASPAYAKAQVALAMQARSLALDPERTAQVGSAIGDVGARLDAARKAVNAALDGDAKDAPKRIDEEAKAWNGTAAAAWFAEARRLPRMQAAVAGFEAAAASPQAPAPTAQRNLLKELEAARDAFTEPAFKARCGALIARVQALKLGR